MPKIMRKAAPKPTKEQQLAAFLFEARQKFGEQYRVTGITSVLIAREALEHAVEHGDIEPDVASQSLKDPNTFASMLLNEEARYKKREDQKIHFRMSKLERGTHWLIGLSMGAAFLVAGPFVTTWLQPTADELFKRKSVPQAQITPQPQPVQNITNINSYNFYTPEPKAAASQSTSESQPLESRPVHKLACKNAVIRGFQNSLLELLQRGDIVTLEAHGKKVSLCYRPVQDSTGQRKTLANKF